MLPPKRRLHLFAVNLVKVKVIKYSFLHLLLDLSRRCKALPGTTYVAIHKGQIVRTEMEKSADAADKSVLFFSAGANF